jgi:CelD/BcsL family acetyltransferase involved in cellulose biosynthesis
LPLEGERVMVRSSLESEGYTVRKETFESLSSYPLALGRPLAMSCPFVLPTWLRVWWDTFGQGQECRLLGVRKGEDLIGIAPLQVKEAEATFIGAPELCDHLDFITAPGRDPEFFRVLIRELRQHGVSILELAPVRADSTVMKALLPEAKSIGCNAIVKRESVSYELFLPETWEEYLGRLKGTERHEIRRKLKRLGEAARIEFRTVEEPKEVRDAMETFLKLFGTSRPDKATFLTRQRARFFRSLAEGMAEAGLLKLSFLELDARPAAAVICFHDPSTVYLYNNGYDSHFRSLSVGLLSKVLSIQEAIQAGKKKYDFLKGSEAYKRRLGGKPVALYRCRVLIA